MSDRSIPRSSSTRTSGYFTWRRVLVHAGLVTYCLALFLAFDFLYSLVSGGEEKQRSPRIANAVYDHGLAANFDGYDTWAGYGTGCSRTVSGSRTFRFAMSRRNQVPVASS
jgi:hypothetical protein